MSNRVRVLIAGTDDDFSELLHLVLRQEESLAVVGSVPNGRELLRIGPAVSPNVVLLDLDAPGPETMQALPELRTHLPSTATVGLAGEHGVETIPAGQPVQLSLVLHKTDPLERLLADIRDAGTTSSDAPAGSAPGPRWTVQAAEPPAAPTPKVAPPSAPPTSAAPENLPAAQIAEAPVRVPVEPALQPIIAAIAGLPVNPLTEPEAKPAEEPAVETAPDGERTAPAMKEPASVVREPAHEAPVLQPEPQVAAPAVLDLPAAEISGEADVPAAQTGGLVETDSVPYQTPQTQIPQGQMVQTPQAAGEYPAPVTPISEARRLTPELAAQAEPANAGAGNAVANGGQMMPVMVELVVSSFGSFRSLAAFQAALEGLSDIINARIRRFHRGTLYETVRYAGADPLEQRLLELRQYQPVVIASRPGSIELQVTPGDEGVLEASTPE